MIIPSISYDQDEILKWIMELYLDGKPFELDPTYSKGNFYKHGVPEPELKFDISPQVDDCMKADVRDLPLADESIRSCIFDPPFIHGGGLGIPGRMQNRFGSLATNKLTLELYADGMKEINRVLIIDGVLIVKCQDEIESSKQKWTHIYVFEIARELGFIGDDLFILLARSRIGNWKRQFHARKFHSYFWVFRKKR